MDLISWLIIFSIIAQVGLVLAVLARDINKSSHRAFGVFGSLLALWSTALFFFDQSTAETSTFWIKIVYAISILFVFSGLYFANNFPTRTIRGKFGYLKVVHVLFAVVMTYMLFFTDNWIVYTELNSIGHYVKLGWAYYIYGIWIIIYAIQTIWTIYLKGKVLSGIEKNQLNLMIFALTLLSFWVIVPDIILPIVFDYPYLFTTSAIGTGLFTAVTAYSVLKYRLLKVRVILGNLLYHVLIGLIPYVLFFVLIKAYIHYFGGVFNTSVYVTGLFVALLFAFLFIKFNDVLKNFLNEYFIYMKYNPLEIVNELVQKTSVELNLDKISKKTLRAIKKALDINRMGVILLDREDEEVKYVYWHKNPEKVGYEESNDVIKYWSYKEQNNEEIKQALILEEIENKRVNLSVTEFEYLKKVIKFMKRHEIELILPLGESKEIYGFVILGKKNDLAAYTLEEIKFLENVVVNVSMAFERALLYKKVEKFNETLKQKVEEATKKLRNKNKKLEEARRKERDMMDIMGHELRTPASVVKINADMLGRFKKKVDLKDKETCEKFMEQMDKSLPRIKDAIENELRLINILLTSAKMEGNRLELHKNEVNILKLIDMGVHSQEKDAEKKDLYLKYEKPEDVEKFPTVYGDQVRLQEVLYNLINNAVKYTKEGGVTVTAESNRKKGFVEVFIEDTGIGISDKEISKLGQKFYRVGQYINQKEEDKGENRFKKGRKRPDIVRPGGTGLGLYVTFEIVKAHGGEVHIESEPGEGSVFSFTVPIYDSEKHEENDEEKVKDVFTRLGLKK